ncbi:FAD-dependent oxidoreductase [Pararhodobacter zhoushanensis]|uniref:FAD-dependent oxidoreductase n=1 Tax=Pararhodobacter zhoushanensis TaxID=2479545 RepID=A0ABT3H578_9RHOB|nr:FAD-dependent oxidoreductase [Pararhodobacter zhoushanensis]MCW1934957.1 FAD-dependent oxidoreductase [Pararhodobacter zhoushanensis]
MQRDCDVLVVGAGAGGMATAITAAKLGLKVMVIEKAPVFGGTTAFSGGVLWIPGNPADASGREAARTYLKSETGNFYDEEAVELFLDEGPRMMAFFERETAMKFVPTLYPDYHPDAPGGAKVGRSVLAAPFDASVLGDNLKRLRPPLKTITFMGMMFNSSNADIKHFFNATKSAKSFFYVAKRLAAHMVELGRYGRGVTVTSGNALAARLAKSCFDLGIEIHTDTPALRLLHGPGGVTGAEISTPQGPVTVTARRGVVLAAGGFAQDVARIRQAYPHLRQGGDHLSPVPEANTGDGITLAQQIGARFDTRLPATAAWIPVSAVPVGGGKRAAFPHLIDRYKPGVIAVLPNGKRFTNESNSYHDVGAAMIAACEGEAEAACWLIADREALRTYGLGFVKPAPMPIGRFLRNGYLKSGRTLAELARACGIKGEEFEATVRRFNAGAERGEDPEFQRGSTAFNRYLADPEHGPNPCVAPIRQGPFYAVKLLMGDLGTFDGLACTPKGQVLDMAGQPIPGLFAVGNDRASVMGGNYPGAGITLGPAMTFGYVTGRHLAGVV